MDFNSFMVHPGSVEAWAFETQQSEAEDVKVEKGLARDFHTSRDLLFTRWVPEQAHHLRVQTNPILTVSVGAHHSGRDKESEGEGGGGLTHTMAQVFKPCRLEKILNTFMSTLNV